MNFKIGDNIVYGATGVCQIDDIKDISFFNQDPEKYYVLKPLFTNRESFVYVQCDNEQQVSRFAPVLSRKEAMALIESLPIVSCKWIEDRNKRKEYFSDILANGTRKDILALIHTIRTRQGELAAAGKKLNAQDDKALHNARVRMNNEFAIALDIEPDNVTELIMEKTGLENPA